MPDLRIAFSTGPFAKVVLHASDLTDFAQFKLKTVMSPLSFICSNLDRIVFDNNAFLSG
jgi:hypothetical protein